MGSMSPSPALKRKRSQSPLSVSSDAEQALKDDKYYFGDGSCTILVNDTLFKVHKTMLARDNSFFASMFSSPSGHYLHTSPIVLTGDSVSEFRNFCWALYALPPELQLLSTQEGDLSKMIDIARISNKYSFRSLEAWILDVIQQYINRRPSPLITSINPSEYTFSPSTTSETTELGTFQLIRLIRLADICNHPKLMNTMISVFKQLMNNSLQHAYLAMTLADELDIKPLRGPAYLQVMRKAPIVNLSKADTLIKTRDNDDQEMGSTSTIANASSSSSTTTTPSEPSEPPPPLIINPSQQLRLLSGYYRLTQTWEKLRTNPPHFDHSASCNATWHQHGCTQSWLEFWKEKTKNEIIVGMNLADVISRIKQIQQEYGRWGSATYMHHDCRMAAKRSLDDIARSIEEALAEYFADGTGW